MGSGSFVGSRSRRKRSNLPLFGSLTATSRPILGVSWYLFPHGERRSPGLRAGAWEECPCETQGSCARQLCPYEGKKTNIKKARNLPQRANSVFWGCGCVERRRFPSLAVIQSPGWGLEEHLGQLMAGTHPQRRPGTCFPFSHLLLCSSLVFPALQASRICRVTFLVALLGAAFASQGKQVILGERRNEDIRLENV